MGIHEWHCEVKQDKVVGPESVPPLVPTALLMRTLQPAGAVSRGTEVREELLWFQRWDGVGAQDGGGRMTEGSGVDKRSCQEWE